MATKAELQRQLVKTSREASAYQEAFWALKRGDEPINLSCGDYAVQLLAPGRMCGGLVVQGPHVHFADEWISNVGHDPYLNELAGIIRRHQTEAVKSILPHR